MNVTITNIQYFCMDDGPGIRTTVFLKGCTIHCPWCGNPENISFKIESYGNDEIFGYEISLKNLEKELLKDEIFYSLNDGGVTFSGGEPLIQINNLEPLLKSLKEKNINICIESALFVPINLLKVATKYIDEYLIDIKILDKEECKNILKGDIETYYNNLNYLFSGNRNITFRIPLINEYTLKEKNINLILELLKKYSPNKIEIFKIHNLGDKKYKVLKKEVPNFSKVQDNKVHDLYEKIYKINRNVEILKL